MGQYETERLLTVLYSLSACLSIITLSSSAAAWIHWREILDTCANYRCGCVLYGGSNYYAFRGGTFPFCQFATFAPLPSLIIAVILAVYHGYNVCIATRRSKASARVRVTRQPGNANIMVINSPSEEPDSAKSRLKCWMLLAALTTLVAVLILANAAVLTDGYYKTCDEYRRTLVKYLQASGQTAAVIYDRLSCTAIFDFMDYQEPITRPFRELEGVFYRPEDERRDFFRGDRINTGIALNLAIVSAWINFIIWFSAIVHNCILARGGKKCCACCRS